jgi:hypothetical protein
MSFLTDKLESIYSTALAMIAQGETRADTKAACMTDSRIALSEIDVELACALRDALKQGVEREDVDPSWFSR